MKILCLKPKDSSVYKYRFDRPLIEGMKAKFTRSLLRKNEKIRLDKLAERFKKKCDVLVIKYLDHRYSLDVLYSLRNIGKFKIVVDIDDNIWQIPLGNIARRDAKTFSKRAIMTIESVKAADWITVSTEPLKQILKNINQNIATLPNFINPEEWKFKRKQHKKVRIGWVWSPTHFPDNAVVEEALKEIYKKYQDKAEIVIFGTGKNIFDFDTVNIPAVPYYEYPKTFMEAGIDISIAPLEDNDFNKCKSDIKWQESTMGGAAFIGSKVYPYEFSVKHGKTGYVCKGKDQWIKHLTHLIENPNKRKELVKSARVEVLKQCEEHKKKWQDFYKYLDAER
jgi:hypothetical protein